MTVPLGRDKDIEQFHTEADLRAAIHKTESDMRAAAANLEFEKAASLRDRLRKLRGLIPGAPADTSTEVPIQ
jgi:excinuclease ABC subunit B